MRTRRQYCIVKTRHLYGAWGGTPRTEKTRLTIDNGNEYLTMEHADAVKHVKKLNEESCYLGHNEHSPATFSIVAS